MQIKPNEIEKVNQLFPYLKDKMVIDFVNGLDVAKRLNQNNKNVAKQGFIKRNLHIISGKQQMAQNNINDHLITGLEACQAYLQEISHHQQAHAHAIITIDNALKQTQNYTIEIADMVGVLKEQVQDIHHSLSSRLDQIELNQRAAQQMESLLSAWQAEQFIELSPMGQCFLVLDTLKRGDFGLYINSLNRADKNQQLDTLKNKVVITQRLLLNKGANDDFLKHQWLTPLSTKGNNQYLQDALQFQGDWSWDNPKNYSMAFTATQLPFLPDDEAEKYDSLVLNMIDINRVSDRMVRNIFQA